MYSLAERQLDQNTLYAVRAFLKRVAVSYPVQTGIVFGSRARGSFRSDSDADVAIVLTGTPSPFLPTKLAMADLAYEILLETGIRIQALPIWEEEWAHPENYSNPRLLQNIEREGVRI
jgi:predicted nucleotidyltransferase